MAPEQARGDAVDARADLYAAGVVLFEMFCGRRPFEAEAWMAVMRQHLSEPPPRPRELQPGIPASLEAVLLRALEKDPDRRFASATEMAEALEAAATVTAGST
jgi:serine/threonine-protein kinase